MTDSGGAIVTLALLIVGAIAFYKRYYPEMAAQQLACEALGSDHYLIAHRFFERLAATGDPAAEFWLADLYEYGLGTGKDLRKAADLLAAAAGKGFVPAQVRLGELYLSGIEIDPDCDKAKDLLSKVGAARNVKAQRLLGQMYAAGFDDQRNAFMAAVYFNAAALQGDRLAVPERDRVTAQLSPDQIAQIRTEITRLGLRT
jgi:TPR repeat protein